MAGLYLHIPFCARKCAYCSFYSACVHQSLMDGYLKALIKEIEKWGGSSGRPFETVYIGGGTPSLLDEKIIPLIAAVKNSFSLTEDCEITAEMNPTASAEEFLLSAKKAGVNRLSIGVQSAIDSELSLLGRAHTAKEAKQVFLRARELGFENISLDLMTGLPNSNKETLKRSLDFLCELSPEHISAYILKIEEKTALYKRTDLQFADEDTQAEQYLYTCEHLENCGYTHYEISNFAKKGFESRHNTKYWKCEEYLGIGAAAHSFLGGKRFYYPADLKAFIKNPQTVYDGTGGDAQEYLMLNLRLKEGIDLKDYFSRFSLTPKNDFYTFLELLEKQKLGHYSKNRFSLTDKGMLLSNTVITEILERII